MNSSRRQRCLDIALNIADSLAEPHPEDTFADHAAAAVLHAVTAPWRSAASAQAHRRLDLAVRHLPTPVPAGVWTGLAGVLFATDIVSAGQGRYERILSQGLNMLAAHARQVTQRYAAAPQKVNTGDVDLISGLTGVARLLLASVHTGRTELQAPLTEVLAFLAAIIHRRSAWRGFGVAHGVAGPLTVLSLARIAGITVPGQVTAIRRIATELANDDSTSRHAPASPWCYGRAGIAHAMLVAADSLDDSNLYSAAATAIGQLADADHPGDRCGALGICHGGAGLLLVATRATQRARDPALASAADTLAQQLVNACETRFSQHPPEWPRGLLTGSAGIALALHQYVHHDQPLGWDRPFLTS